MTNPVIPAKAGIQKAQGSQRCDLMTSLDSGSRPE